MSTKKTAPSFATESGLVQQNCTSRKGKGSEIPQELQEQGWQEVPLEKRIRYQRQKISAALSVQSEMGATRMMIARATDIERANVCRRVAELRKEGRIWICGKHPCKITGARAEYLTCDQNTAFEYYLAKSEGIWARLKDQRMIDEAQLAIWNYLFEDDFGSGGFYFKEIEELWPEIRAIIDKEAGR